MLFCDSRGENVYVTALWFEYHSFKWRKIFSGSNISFIKKKNKLVSLDTFSERYLFHFVVSGQKLAPFVLDLRTVSNLTAAGKREVGYGEREEKGGKRVSAELGAHKCHCRCHWLGWAWGCLWGQADRKLLICGWAQLHRARCSKVGALMYFSSPNHPCGWCHSH